MMMSKAFVLFSTLVVGVGAVKTMYQSPETDGVADWTDAKTFCEARKSNLVTKDGLCEYFGSRGVAGENWAPALDYTDSWFQIGQDENDFCEAYDKDVECPADKNAETVPPTDKTKKPTEKPTNKPTANPTEEPGGGALCSKPVDCNGLVCAYTCDLPAGYYPDPTDCRSYCKCTGTVAPSRYETIPGNNLIYDPWGRSYWTAAHGKARASYTRLKWANTKEYPVPLGGMNGGIKNWAYNNKELGYCGNNYNPNSWRGKRRRTRELESMLETCDIDPNYIVCDRTPDGTSSGDPHFKTWGGQKYDFHGECDLVLLENPGFANGLGIRVHVRTKIRQDWSFIQAAALQIGEDTLEVTGGKESFEYLFNGEAPNELEENVGLFGFPMNFTKLFAHQSKLHLNLGDGNAISLETYRDFVRVNVKAPTEEEFQGSSGLLGSYPDGQKLARDGSTLVESANEFGQEWQVISSEPMLFRNASEHPLKCILPDQKLAQKSRRLGEAELTLTEADAADACAGTIDDDRRACIFDVLATNDVDMAGSYM